MFFLLIMTYLTVFTGELIGDKLLYTIGTLATRYRVLPMLCGVGLAFMGKMMAAVILGGLISRLPMKLVAAVSACTFFAMAVALTFKTPKRGIIESKQSGHWFRPVVVAFSVVFFSEWGDVGQVAAAALAARYQAPLVIWFGATLAMVTKAALAMTIGITLQNRISQEALRYCGVCLLFSLGVLSLLSVAFRR